MKAKELMIGDWVHVNAVFNIVQAHNSKVGYLTRMHDKSIFIEGDGWGVFEEGIEPIPLTEGLLKANGFKKERYGWLSPKMAYVEEGFIVDITTTNVRSIGVTDHDEPVVLLGYVHELQHALRLCGLVELADNFMIE